MIRCESCIHFSYLEHSIMVGLCHEKKRFGKPKEIDLTKDKNCSYYEERDIPCLV